MTDQIIDILFTVQGRVQLDLTRAVEDPNWDHYTRGLNLGIPEQLQQAVHNYVSAYLRNEQLLSDNAPWTNGPADIYGVVIKINEKPNYLTSCNTKG